jgi:hypothetical protein
MPVISAIQEVEVGELWFEDRLDLKQDNTRTYLKNKRPVGMAQVVEWSSLLPKRERERERVCSCRRRMHDVEQSQPPHYSDAEQLQ